MTDVDSVYFVPANDECIFCRMLASDCLLATPQWSG